MCGIAGYFGPRNLSDKIISSTLSLMENRGPDSKKFYRLNFKNKSLYLFHSRLKIIDLTNNANQPFFYNKNILVYNGEIYNYLEIKKKLQKIGYKFKTTSDTEVVLMSYLHFGEKCVDHFEGMWAFAIWDDARKKLFLSRDRFGEKPLFYSRKNKEFIFGSETKLVQTLSDGKFNINDKLVKKNLVYGFKSIHKTDETYFDKIFSLSKSSYSYVDYLNNFSKKKYWEPEFKENKSLTFKDVCNQTKFLLKKSLEKQLISDVPISLSLSGGIDSSILAGLIKKDFKKNITSFSLIDHSKYNEEHLINDTQKFLDLKNNKIKIKYKSFLENLKSTIDYHNEPISTITYFVQNFLMKEVGKSNFKVIMSGTGADELFTGYYDHFLQFFSTIQNKKNRNISINEWKQFVLPIIKNKSLKQTSTYIKNKNDRSHIYDNYKENLKYTKFKIPFLFKEKKFCNNLLRNRMLNELFYEITPVTLRHEDLNCMNYSIENRSPFLDTNLFKFANTIPTNFLIQEGFQKFVLRKTFKNIMHPNVVNHRSKIGFNASLNLFIKNEKKNNLKNFFYEDSPVNDFVNMKNIFKLTQKKNLTPQVEKFLFNVMNIKIFLDKHY
jgi:asparagine synthase (glutamine-hydrolysing)